MQLEIRFTPHILSNYFEIYSNRKTKKNVLPTKLDSWLVLNCNWANLIVNSNDLANQERKNNQVYLHYIIRACEILFFVVFFTTAWMKSSLFVTIPSETFEIFLIPTSGGQLGHRQARKKSAIVGHLHTFI